ncbi:MAG: hypothetical protein K2X93_28650 [Candidatus Obscuribacterales bacterium]|nr:hypothetical protein [Candidatus Obscuribacterales bacterium]
MSIPSRRIGPGTRRRSSTTGTVFFTISQHILPEAFVHYEADDDNVIEYAIKVGAAKRTFRARIERTIPDREFSEIDLNTGIITEFLLEPHEQGTLVTISTVYESKRGLTGLIEALFVPTLLHRLFREELVKLGRYVLLVD